MELTIEEPISRRWAEESSPEMQKMWTKELRRLTTDGPFKQAPAVTAKGVRYENAFVNGPHTLRDYYQDCFRCFADRDFLVFNNERYSFEQVRQLAEALACSLESTYGVTSGRHVVAISMANCPEWCIAFFAATLIGAIAVPMNSMWTSAEYEYPLKNCGANILICDQLRMKNAAATCHKLNIPVMVARSEEPGNGMRCMRDEILAHLGSKPKLATNIHTDDVAAIMYTSGSTGNPKGVLLSHRGFISQFKATQLKAKLKQHVEQKVIWSRRSIKSQAATVKNELPTVATSLRPSTIVPVPLFHATGLHHGLLSSLGIGRKVVLMTKWSPQEALRIIEAEQVTGFFGVPTMVQDLLNCPSRSRFDTSSLLTVGGGGAAMTQDLCLSVPKHFANGMPEQGYGLTETNGGVCDHNGAFYLARPSSIGMPNAVSDIIVRDMQRNKVPTGQRGELWVKSAQNMLGYHQQPEKTRAVLDEDGYFATGDIGYVDAAGFVYVTGRSKELIIRGGENISTGEVEEAFLAHSLVEECACISLPDKRLGEAVGVVVFPASSPSSQPELAKDLCAFVQKRLAKFKVPRPEHVFVWDSKLPRMATQKINKRALRDTVVTSLHSPAVQASL